MRPCAEEPQLFSSQSPLLASPERSRYTQVAPAKHLQPISRSQRKERARLLAKGKEFFFAHYSRCRGENGDKPLKTGVPLSERELFSDVIARAGKGRLRDGTEEGQQAVTLYIFSLMKTKHPEGKAASKSPRRRSHAVATPSAPAFKTRSTIAAKRPSALGKRQPHPTPPDRRQFSMTYIARRRERASLCNSSRGKFTPGLEA
jgi:hypothetical protein